MLVDSDSNALSKGLSPVDKSCVIQSTTWNIAAINNNPFEYWITNPDPAYNSLIAGVQNFIESPVCDVQIRSIFTDQMFSDLQEEMRAQNIPGADELASYWLDDYSGRMAVDQFLKDKTIGMKRLASMPDRLTNTIQGGAGVSFKRPTAINAYDGESLKSVEEWWPAWKRFIFHTSIQFQDHPDTDHGICAPTLVCNMLGSIARTKYPAITEKEEKISIALQLLCLGILDAIFIFMLNTVDSSWEKVRKELCDALILNKAANVSAILARSYQDQDVIFIQEAAAIFTDTARRAPALHDRFALFSPSGHDGARNQNSLILLARARFVESSCVEVTDRVLAPLARGLAARGDLLAVTVDDADGGRWLLASFHGDSDGHATRPVMGALDAAARATFPQHRLLVGIDANTYSGSAGEDAGRLSVDSFCAFLQEHGLVSLWGTVPDASLRTTSTARTYLQTQLNKATPFARRGSMAQQNLKDWIVGYACQVAAVSGAQRDNTGARRFVETVVLPTLDFPSDHVIVSATFHFRPEPHSADETCPLLSSSAAASADALTQRRSSDQIAASPSHECEEKRQRMNGNALHTQADKRTNVLCAVVANVQSLWASATVQGWGFELARSILQSNASPTRSSDDESLANLDPDLYDEDISTFCERHFVRFVKSPKGGELNRKNLMLSESDDGSIGILFSSRPFSIVMCKRSGQIGLLCSAVIFLLEVALNIWALQHFAALEASQFRFTALKLRNFSLPVSRPGIESIGVMHDGCLLRSERNSFNTSEAGNARIVEFEHPVSINGWYFVTQNANAQEDPVSFAFERLDGSDWLEVGTPPWLRQSSLLYVPLERQEVKLVDLRPPWQWVLQWCCGQMCLALGCLAASIFGFAGRGRWAAWACVVTYLVFSITSTVIALSHSLSGVADDQALAVLDWVISFSFLVLAAVLANEQYVAAFFPWVYSVLCTAILFERLATNPNILGWASIALPVFWSGSPALLGLCEVFGTYLIRLCVTSHIIKLDRQAYDKVWTNIVLRDLDEGILTKLDECALRMERWQSAVDVRQRHRGANNDSSSSSSPGIGFLQSIISSRYQYLPLVSNLDQLYSQAACLNIFLRKKLKHLALLSNGHFQVRPTELSSSKHPTFLRYEEVLQSQEQYKVKFEKLKPTRRALEKLLRVYDCDVSRLLDCCRQTIYFNRLEDLLVCLQAISCDPDFLVMRIRNRISKSYNSCHSGGHRSIILNLRINCTATRDLGVDTHICELQLSLKSLAALQDEESHRRFLMFRNSRRPLVISKLTKNALRHAIDSLILPLVHYVGSKRSSHKISPGSHQDSVILNVDRTKPDNESFKPVDRTKMDYFNSDLSASCQDFPPHSTALASRTWLEEERRQMLSREFFISVTSLGRYNGSLLDEGRVLARAMLHAAAGSVWDTSHPFAAALCKQHFPIYVSIGFLLFVLGFVLSMTTIVGGNSWTGIHFRFSALKLRSGLTADQPGINSFGLMKGSCTTIFEGLQSNLTVTNASVMISFPESVTADGWWFRTSDHNIDEDPVKFHLEASNNYDGSSWNIVGSSTYLWTWAGQPEMLHGYFKTPSDRLQHVMFDLRLPWIWCVTKISCYLLLMGMAVSVLVCTFIKRQIWAKWGIALSYLVISGVELVATIGYLVQGHAALATISGIFMLVDFGFAVVFIYAEKYARHYCGISGTIYIGTILAQQHAFRKPGITFRTSLVLCENRGLVEGIGLILLSSSAALMRYRSRRQANRIVAQDQTAYEERWNQVVQIATESGAIHRLCQLAATLSPIGSTRLQQRTSPNGPGEIGNIVKDLDQLFAMASGLHPYLQSKVQQWAAASGGCFQVLVGKEPTFIPWDEISTNDAVYNKVKWARPKLRSRAVEKVFRSYNCDVSLLLDCCRQSIYFEGLEGIIRCIGAISADQETQVKRVVNRLQHSYDSATTAGYRDISLNMLLRTPDSVFLGLDGHVCEVQLVLVSFAEIKVVSDLFADNFPERRFPTARIRLITEAQQRLS